MVVQDTAEVYGDGKSEEFVGQFIKRYPAEMAGFDKIVVATKYLPNFDRFWYPRSLIDAAEASIKRLGIRGPIDLYYVSARIPGGRKGHYCFKPPLPSACLYLLTASRGNADSRAYRMGHNRDFGLSSG